MFLEIVTLVMLVLVVLLKYCTVRRIEMLNQKLRDAENLSKRHESVLERKRDERKVSEREEANLSRQRVNLESEMKRLDDEWTQLRNANTEVLNELLPNYTESEEDPKGPPPEPDSEKGGEISKN